MLDGGISQTSQNGGQADVAVRARFSAGVSTDLGHDYSILVRNEVFFDLNGTSRIRNAGFGENQLIAMRPIPPALPTV